MVIEANRTFECGAPTLETPGNQLSDEQSRFFRDNGYLGPLVCKHPSVTNLPEILYRAGVCNYGSKEPIPEPSTWTTTAVKNVNVHDPHRCVPEIMAICAHPSIVTPVAGVLGTTQVAFFQSRFRVKFPQREDPVPWHQDVGKSSGGYRSDGTPVPSVTAWLSIDGASQHSGSLRLVPGTHKELIGDWRSGFQSKLEETDTISDEEMLTRSVPLECNPDEFYLLHSWTLHRSTPNVSKSNRSALVLRFVRPNDAVLRGIEYTMLSANTTA